MSHQVPGKDPSNTVILVVEDETDVRALITRALKSVGYLVLEAKNGQDALKVLEEHKTPAHLVITDMVMPEMGGAQLTTILHAWFPELRVLFISAYSKEMMEAKGVLFPGARYLPKPCSIDTLTKAVRELLDS